MQKISINIFKIASVCFGIFGLCLVLFGGPNDNAPVNQFFMRLILTCVFIILPSFALSVAGKYLNNK
jgi:hypothetical protein